MSSSAGTGADDVTRLIPLDAEPFTWCKDNAFTSRFKVGSEALAGDWLPFSEQHNQASKE